MSDPQESTERGLSALAPPADAPVTADYENVGRRFEAAYQGYLAALQQTHIDGQRRWVEAHRDYASAAQHIWLETQKRLGDANHQYAAAVQDAWGQEDAQRLVTEAYENYVRALQEACDENQRQHEEAYAKYAEPLRQAAAETKSRWEQAYQDYINAVKEAWAAAEAGVLDVNTLAAISYSIANATLFASNTVGLSAAGQES